MDRKEQIKELRQSGLTYQKIADKFNISRQRVHQILTGYSSPSNLTKYIESQIRSYLAQKKINSLLKEKLKIKVNSINITKITGLNSCSRDRYRELIRIRDSHTCQICGNIWKKRQRRFDIHHLDEDNTKTKQSDNLGKEADNMITLCHKCHLNLPGHKEAMKLSNRK